ncbi:glutathione S-transferase family protein [Pseudomonas sp. TH41]|uniref:glutathione S-transferase family protein n=1 Tax=Pseudomonas sp. TH41 TaxID=2796405 RepID=UPI001911DB20|nr:glutathione S-transferase family protein [Pseudomonas sp. TH41]MBK5356601.1 glutathione S-transferase family protein [Pseudomonas sp. TH41]
MITLYHCMSARSFRPLWALEELGLSYKLNMLPFPPRVHARQYLDINPIGTVPALVIDDILMTESAAICQYLAKRFGPTALEIDPEEPDYAKYLNWLHYGEATLTFPQTLILRYGQFEEPQRRLPQVVEDYSRWFLGRLKAISSALEGREYLCQNRFTIADISVGYALMLAEFIGLGDRFPENVMLYWQRLQSRESFTKAWLAIAREVLGQTVQTFLDSNDAGRDGAFCTIALLTPPQAIFCSYDFVLCYIPCIYVLFLC